MREIHYSFERVAQFNISQTCMDDQHQGRMTRTPSLQQVRRMNQCAIFFTRLANAPTKKVGFCGRTQQSLRYIIHIWHFTTRYSSLAQPIAIHKATHKSTPAVYQKPTSSLARLIGCTRIRAGSTNSKTRSVAHSKSNKKQERYHHATLFALSKSSSNSSSHNPKDPHP